MPVNSSIKGVKHNAKIAIGILTISGKFFEEILSHKKKAMMWIEMVRVIVKISKPLK